MGIYNPVDLVSTGSVQESSQKFEKIVEIAESIDVDEDEVNEMSVSIKTEDYSPKINNLTGNIFRYYTSVPN